MGHGSIHRKGRPKKMADHWCLLAKYLSCARDGSSIPSESQYFYRCCHVHVRLCDSLRSDVVSVHRKLPDRVNVLPSRPLTGKCYAIQLVYASELMPLRFRHTGYCLSVSVFSLFGWLLVFAAPISYTRGGSHGWTTWMWFLVFNVIAAPYGKQISKILLCPFLSLKVDKFTFSVPKPRAKLSRRSIFFSYLRSFARALLVRNLSRAPV